MDPEHISWSIITPVRDNDKLLGFIALHRATKEHPAFGATRIEPYPSTRAALDDALNLAWLMSYKAALAGIPYGGGKGVLFNTPELSDPIARNKLLEIYAKHVNMLDGRFVTGSDAGVLQEDVNFLKSHSPHIVGITEDPTSRTAEGLIGVMKITLHELYGDHRLDGRTFAILGVGKVGGALLEILAGKAKRIIVADIDPERIKWVRKQYPKVDIASADTIHLEKVDIFAPCALGGIITPMIAETLNARAVVGSANNQLSSDHAGDILYERGILYAPDYVANAGGLISVVHEYEKGDQIDLDSAVATIPERVAELYHLSKTTNTPTHRLANRLATERIDTLFQVPQKTKKGLKTKKIHG